MSPGLILYPIVYTPLGLTEEHSSHFREIVTHVDAASSSCITLHLDMDKHTCNMAQVLVVLSTRPMLSDRLLPCRYPPAAMPAFPPTNQTFAFVRSRIDHPEMPATALAALESPDLIIRMLR